jgi:hypothetical protein
MCSIYSVCNPEVKHTYNLPTIDFSDMFITCKWLACRLKVTKSDQLTGQKRPKVIGFWTKVTKSDQLAG